MGGSFNLRGLSTYEKFCVPPFGKGRHDGTRKYIEEPRHENVEKISNKKKTTQAQQAERDARTDEKGRNNPPMWDTFFHRL